MDGHCYFKKKLKNKKVLNHKQPASFQFPRRLLNDEGNISARFFFLISTPIQKVFISALFFFFFSPNAIQWNSEFTGLYSNKDNTQSEHFTLSKPPEEKYFERTLQMWLFKKPN